MYIPIKIDANPLKFISKFIKSSNQKTLDKLSLMVNKINLLENEISNLDDVDFPAKTNFLKDGLKSGEDIKYFTRSFCVGKRSFKRTRGERHFDVQIMGGIST